VEEGFSLEGGRWGRDAGVKNEGGWRGVKN